MPLATLDNLLLSESKNHFETLRRRYQRRGIVPFLGAGVPAACGLPSWKELTKRIFERMADAKKYQDLLADENTEEIAKLSFAAERIGSGFLESLRSCLYAQVTFPESSTPAGLRSAMMIQNPTMAAIAELLCQREGDHYVPNPRLPAILTTNVDDLLQRLVRRGYPQASGKPILRTIERASAGPLERRTPIYHLHGLLKSKRSDRDEEATDMAVFTEREYLLVYRDSHSVFSYTPLFLMREYPVLFLGVGMKDPNVRRLLAWSQWEIEQGYRQEGQATPSHKEFRHFALLREVSKTEREIVTTLLRPLGVATIWYRKHQDVPQLLQQLQLPAESENSSISATERLRR